MNASPKPLPLGLTVLILLALLLSSARVAAPVSAADLLVVTSIADDGDGSLRQAIGGISPGGTIKFHPDLSGQTIVLDSTLVININLMIDGSSLEEPITISGNDTVRVFEVYSFVADAILKHLTISDGNSSDNPVFTSGGGIINTGQLTLINCTFTDHQTDWNGGAIWNSVEGTLTIENSQFYRNQSKYHGGAIVNDGTMIVRNSIFTDNQCTDHHGGGIANFGTLEISASSFSDNSSGSHGGGIYNEAIMTLISSTLSNNHSLVNGGGLYNTMSGNLTMINSTLSGNITKGEQGDGGGIYNTGTATIINSTLSGNIVEGDYRFGGGIINFGNLTLTNSTLFGNKLNHWGGGGGGIYNGNNANLNYTNTIIAHSVGGDCRNFGTITNSTHNLVQDGSCYVATNLSGDPKLGPLADNGGPTLTHALLYSSPAIDAGSDIHCPDYDQRGVPRPQGAGCDIGAYELETLVVTNASNDLVGSLREAIALISPGGRITLRPSLSGQTITLASPLVIEKNLMIDGSGLGVPITISGNNAVGVFVIGPLGEATLDSLKIINGDREIGGGIYNLGQLAVVNSVLSGNMGDDSGGGIFNQGELTVTNSTISGNKAYSGGGGILSLGELTIMNSTLSGNIVYGGGGGGGISNIGNLNMTNSTISGNIAAAGGGVYNSGEISIRNSTFYGNVAEQEGGGVYNDNTGTLNFTNTIIAYSTKWDCANYGAFHFGNTHNLVQDESCNADFSGDPLLDSLADNGGPTLTHALLPGSPAIDAGSMADCPNTDQRGFYRPFDGNVDGVLGCDIGAFELHFSLIYLPLILK